MSKSKQKRYLCLHGLVSAGCSDGKKFTCKATTHSSILAIDRGDWRTTVYVVTELDTTEQLTLCFFLLCPCPQMREFHIPDRVSLSLDVNIFRAKLHFGGKSY